MGAIRVNKNLYGTVSHFYHRYIIGATVAAGVPVLRETVVANPGEVKLATMTGFAHCLGITGQAVTYSTTQGDMSGRDANLGVIDLLGRSVGVIIQPHSVHRFRVSGSATSGAALAQTAPAQIIKNTSANTVGLVVTAAEIGTVDNSGGTLIGRDGANANFSRKIASVIASTSATVTVPFPYTIGVNDTFFYLPYSSTCEALQLTTDLTEANGAIASGLGGRVAILGVTVQLGLPKDEMVVDAIFTDHYFNPFT